MAKKAPSSFLHYDPKRVDYTVSADELNQLADGHNNTWKDFFIFCVSFGIPCMANSIPPMTADPFVSTLPFNINLLLGAVGLMLGAAFGVAWWKTRGAMRALTGVIKDKPQVAVDPQFSTIGRLTEGSDVSLKLTETPAKEKA